MQHTPLAVKKTNLYAMNNTTLDILVSLGRSAIKKGCDPEKIREFLKLRGADNILSLSCIYYTEMEIFLMRLLSLN